MEDLVKLGTRRNREEREADEPSNSAKELDAKRAAEAAAVNLFGDATMAPPRAGYRAEVFTR
jgi:hypothetical protein